MKESEIEEIIERRKVLVETATSEAQKEIYQESLEYWEGLIKGKPKPEPEPVWGPAEEAKITIVRKDPDGVHEQLKKSYEELFKLEYPNKQAYYNRDGQKLKTKAFIEFLNKSK